MVLHDMVVSFRRSFHEGAQFPMAVRLFAVRLENHRKARGRIGLQKVLKNRLKNP
jgi:hypothetical protein